LAGVGSVDSVAVAVGRVRFAPPILPPDALPDAAATDDDTMLTLAGM